MAEKYEHSQSALPPGITGDNRHRKIYRKQSRERGIAALEFAFLLPVFIILMFAVISFGYGFVVYEENVQAASSIAQIISSVPYSQQAATLNQTPGVAPSTISGIAAPFIGYNGTPATNIGKLCVIPYQTYVQAVQQGPGNCTGMTSGAWDTKSPWPADNPQAYYVFVQTSVTPSLAVPDAFKWIIGKVFRYSTVASVGNNTNLGRTWQYVGGSKDGNRSVNQVYYNYLDYDITVSILAPPDCRSQQLALAIFNPGDTVGQIIAWSKTDSPTHSNDPHKFVQATVPGNGGGYKFATNYTGSDDPRTASGGGWGTCGDWYVFEYK